ncbi:trans-sulfuration enzyme family protein [Pleomorphovibrio marinus]|uniref:trans-sulfuration enzyme family protein n=1 Tax=Pleomorphovibrio marinus TaxID=2164132 RepID=UPI000E0CB0D8|nr:aminotransferase class I/II-fold pyridoxal phosphate-dependent enzyme [Pleomorphovibrio marinus]
MKPETIAIHLSNRVNDKDNPVVQPISLSTTYQHGEGSPIYSRINNPNRTSLEAVMAALEGGEDAAAFASGNAAGMAVFQSLDPKSHIVVPNDMYHGMRNQLLKVFEGKIEVTSVDMTDLQAISKQVRPTTSLIWMETPSNPLVRITDIKEVCKLAKEKGIRTVVDSTFATPILQQPLALGADMVMHSNTKFIGGHSDVLGGILITSEKDEFWEKVRNVQVLGGASPSAFDCYLLCRSIKTLSYRIKAHCENAMSIATFLDSHAKVEKVYYPGLPQDEGNALASRQMTGYGSMLSFVHRGDSKATDVFLSKLKLFSNATSLGGVESLIERRAKVEGEGSKTHPSLVRVSIGIENVGDLMEDIENALDE